ncbi:hypothetical protein GRJ2_001817900 [Grus japonensis]|uniref:Uncharacterized protein n=1 Tax=Grus japonensis TaxID=30415 RepID=A0ABC9X759_GRUJA
MVTEAALELGASEPAPVAPTSPASATARANGPNDDGESGSRRCEEFSPVTRHSQQHILFSLSICNHHRISPEGFQVVMNSRLKELKSPRR